VRVNAAGTILPIDATDLQTRCNSALANALTNQGQVSSAQCVVSLTDLILQTATLSVTFQIQPLGYLNTINITVTFTNVAAVVVGGS
jgi:type III secretory pathway component EscU